MMKNDARKTKTYADYDVVRATKAWKNKKQQQKEREYDVRSLLLKEPESA